jgi:ferredoxin
LKREIIRIDADLCDGCGNCIPGCPEGALRVIDGKARLVSDLFCDGLGACLGECPKGAISIIEREAEPYDEESVMENIVKQGDATVKAHLEHLRDHGEDGYLEEGLEFLHRNKIAVPDGFIENRNDCSVLIGCPGSKTMDIKRAATEFPGNLKFESALTNWPVQLKLVNPSAPFFNNADLVISADCVPFSYQGFHQKFLEGKKLIIFCPKLDGDIDEYIKKLEVIFSSRNIKSVSIVHMEVPCCSGVERIVVEAMKRAGAVIPIREYTVSIGGDLI